MKAELLVVLPDDIGDETAAAVMLKGMTRRVPAASRPSGAGGRPYPGPRRRRRRRPAASASGRARSAPRSSAPSAASRRRASPAAHGCAYPIVYTEEDFVERVSEITKGEGCDVVYDAVGRDTFLGSYEALAVRGHLVSYGQASGPIEPVDISGFVLQIGLRLAAEFRPLHRHALGGALDHRPAVRRAPPRHPQCRDRPALRAPRCRRGPPRPGRPAHDGLDHPAAVRSRRAAHPVASPPNPD